jgi:hypothetical protein
VPEEVAPPDARQQVLGATGWYDRVSWLAMLLPLVQDGILHARFKTSSASAWKWHFLVNEASRMGLLSASERKGGVRCQTHIVQVTPSYNTSTIGRCKC